MKNIVVFASGEGTNAAVIIDYFKNSLLGKVVLVVSSNSNAAVLTKATKRGVSTLVIDKDIFFSEHSINELLMNQKTDLIVLAGFLLKVPKPLIEKFTNRIVNLHPSLLPKFGGKGMFGMNVHKAVINSMEKESGITIHLVNENFDEGKIIFQEKCKVDVMDTPESLSEKVRILEHKYYPLVIEGLIRDNV